MFRTNSQIGANLQSLFLMPVLALLVNVFFVGCVSAVENTPSFALLPMIANNAAHKFSWTPDDNANLVLTVTRSTRAAPSQLYFHSNAAGKLVLIANFDIGDNLVSIVQAPDMAKRLITVWSSGSAIITRVFLYEEGKIKLVLEIGSRGLPEFVYLCNNDKSQAAEVGEGQDLDILVPKIEWFSDSSGRNSVLIASAADIYHWKGRNYEVRRNVTWDKRFQCNEMPKAVGSN